MCLGNEEMSYFFSSFFVSVVSTFTSPFFFFFLTFFVFLTFVPSDLVSVLVVSVVVSAA
jgi:hypothetical protein